MTQAEINYIVKNVLGEALDTISPMLGISHIVINKFERKFPDLNNNRFKFDTTNGILECYYVKPFKGTLPSHWKEDEQFDTYQEKIFQFMLDENEKPIVDYYDITAITAIIGRD